MKKNFLLAMAAVAACLSTDAAFAQAPDVNLVNVQKMKMKWPEKGSALERDSLIAIYNDQVIRKNDKILSHREYSHWFTTDNKDYLVIQEFKDFNAMQEANEMSDELEKKAWPDEKKRKEFFDALDAYFEDWHGDALFRHNPKLSK